MNYLTGIFFTALRTALFNKQLPESLFIDLSAEQWTEFYRLAAKQGVLAICYDVVSALPKEQQPPRNLNIQWALGVERIEQRYLNQNEAAEELAASYGREGNSLMILKGLGLARYYPHNNHRECGDVDIYLIDKTTKHDVLSKRARMGSGHSYYKHDSFDYNGVCIERHAYFTSFRGNREIKWFERLLHEHIDVKREFEPIGDSTLLVAKPTVNALFLVYHTICHFLIEGITLRHLLDWGLFVQFEKERIDWKYFYEVCDKMRYSKFINTVNAILANQFDFVFDDPRIVADSQYVTLILNDILSQCSQHVSGVSTWRRRRMIVDNVVKSRWKYNKIYQHNFFVSMMRSALGIIFDKDAKLY